MMSRSGETERMSCDAAADGENSSCDDAGEMAAEDPDTATDDDDDDDDDVSMGGGAEDLVTKLEALAARYSAGEIDSATFEAAKGRLLGMLVGADSAEDDVSEPEDDASEPPLSGQELSTPTVADLEAEIRQLRERNELLEEDNRQLKKRLNDA